MEQTMQVSTTLPSPRRWVAPPAVAAYTGITVATLATWRCTDPERIRFHKIGRKVVYDLNEVDAALAGSVA